MPPTESAVKYWAQWGHSPGREEAGEAHGAVLALLRKWALHGQWDRFRGEDVYRKERPGSKMAAAEPRGVEAR